MTITVPSGVTSTLDISSGELVVVLSGGELLDSTILGGGSATLSSGAIASDLIVSAGGTLIGPGDLVSVDYVVGFVSGVAVSGVLQLYGSASDVTLLPTSLLDGSGIATGTIVMDGALLENGIAVDSQVESGGRELISSGAVGSGDTIGSGGVLQVELGGSAADEAV